MIAGRPAFIYQETFVTGGSPAVVGILCALVVEVPATSADWGFHDCESIGTDGEWKVGSENEWTSEVV